MTDEEKTDERLNGVFPPITTPFMNQEVAYEELASNIEKWNAAPLKGYVVLGSNGEFPYLTRNEKLRIIGTAVKAAKPAGKVVIAGVSCESARETIEYVRAAGELGADFAIAVTPNYYKPKMTHGALVSYYSAVADESPVPVLIYNMPAYTGVTVRPETVAELSRHPNIAGMKDSAGVMGLTVAYVNAAAQGFTVMAGSASFLLPGLVVGCRGGVLALACAAPEACCMLYDLASQGKYEEARTLQLRLVAPNAAVTSGHGIAGLKYAMELRGYFGGEVRVPLTSLGEDEKKDIETTFRNSALL